MGRNFVTALWDLELQERQQKPRDFVYQTLRLGCVGSPEWTVAKLFAPLTEDMLAEIAGLGFSACKD